MMQDFLKWFIYCVLLCSWNWTCVHCAACFVSVDVIACGYAVIL